MIPKEEIPNPEEMRNAMRVLQIRMRNTGLGHFERIGLRTLRALQHLNLIDNEASPIDEHVDLSVLRDLRHVRRQGHPVGPLLLYVTGVEGEERRMLVELPVLFFSGDQRVRRAALKCLKELTAEDPMALTPKTVNVVENSENGLLSEEPEAWRPAAIAISDALNNDILIALHGVRQSLNSKPVLQDYLNIYTRNLLNPPVTSLDSINLPIGQLERDHETLKKLLTDIIAHASNLTELCNAYFADFGFLPLAPAYSLASAVEEWLGSEYSKDAWHEVWKWANAESTPLARYHACSVFVLLPNLVPEDKFSDLWNEILTVVGRAEENDGTDKPITEAWVLRLNLARHYTYHLEARLPNRDGANIACFAWWFAEKVAALFPADEASAKFYRENWIKPATKLSSHVWLVASAPITNSFLRYATFVVQSPWAVSLMALMGEHMKELSPSQQSKNVQSRFRDALISNSISSFPFQLETTIDPTFALECSLTDTLNAWEKVCLKEDRKIFRQILAMGQTLGSKDRLCAALRKVDGADLPDQVAVITALRAKAYSDPSIGEDVWKVVSRIEWRKKVFGNLKKELQDVLLEGLSLLMIANREKWHSHFPHYVAELCEQETNKKRKKELFLYVVYLSNASGTVSALHYLLRGDQKADFLEYVKEYRVQVEAMRSDYPPWVAGKLRGLMASMYAI